MCCQVVTEPGRLVSLSIYVDGGVRTVLVDVIWRMDQRRFVPRDLTAEAAGAVLAIGPGGRAVVRAPSLPGVKRESKAAAARTRKAVRRASRRGVEDRRRESKGPATGSNGSAWCATASRNAASCTSRRRYCPTGTAHNAVLHYTDVTAERRHRDELAGFAGAVAHDLLKPPNGSRRVDRGHRRDTHRRSKPPGGVAGTQRSSGSTAPPPECAI